MDIVKSLFYFLLAGIFEIGGGYLMWLWLRGEKSLLWGACGCRRTRPVRGHSNAPA